jgi:hypothetical protein
MARKRNYVSESAPDANREAEVQDALKVAQANLQSARERAALPTFVAAEAEESKAFREAQEEVAKVEREKAKASDEPVVEFVPAASEIE